MKFMTQCHQGEKQQMQCCLHPACTHIVASQDSHTNSVLTPTPHSHVTGEYRARVGMQGNKGPPGSVLHRTQNPNKCTHYLRTISTNIEMIS